ncbi:H17B6-like protein [Mya arenaria]|uniref:H17B6-like protein n=1 Tax=Mya arenaria TaxID=6604 RepID=A0ABY7FCF7_MYAAR|nr:H17B6-like protein [Mya arenaria]
MDGYTMICLVVILCMMYHLLKRYIYSLKIISKDKYVLITGCDSGFGYLLAKRLDAIGMHVLAGCLKESSIFELGNALSKKAMAIRLDVTNEESIAEAVELVSATIGDQTGLLALVNNAGLMGTGIGPTVWQTRKDYEDVLSVNFFGVAMVTNAFLPFVLKGKGRIVNIASMKGRIAFHNAPYSVSKYGVEAFSDCLRRDLFNKAVTVHILEPGHFETDLLDRATHRKRIHEKIESLPKAVRDELPHDIKNIMMARFQSFVGRMASNHPEEVVDAYEHAITAKYPKYR